MLLDIHRTLYKQKDNCNRHRFKVFPYDVETRIRYPSRSQCTVYHLVFFTCLLIQCMTLFAPQRLDAQPEILEGMGPVYYDVINTDEDGGKLSYPGFVLAEPVTNEIYVIDGMSRIIIYTPDFFPMYTLTKRNGIESPQGLAVDEKGYILYCAGEDRC